MAFGKGFKFGDTPTSTLIERFKIEHDEVKFITILDITDPVVSNTHYIKGFGSIHCWTHEDEDGIQVKGDCCTTLEAVTGRGFPTSKLVLPVAIFRTKDSKSYEPSDVTFARMEFTQDDYKALLGSLSDDDIEPDEVTKRVLRVRGEETGKGQYKRVSPSFRVRPDKTPILSDATLKAQAKDFLVRYRELIHDSLGKTVDSEKLKKIIANLKLEEGEVTTPDKDNHKHSEAPNRNPEPTTVVEEDIVVKGFEEDEMDLSSILDDDFLNS